MHRKQYSSENMRNIYLNQSNDQPAIVEPLGRSRMQASKPHDPKVFSEQLRVALEALKKKNDDQERLDLALGDCGDQATASRSFPSTNCGQSLSHQAITTALHKIASTDVDNDQDILDQHVSRVFSPLVQSPGTASPRQAAVLARPPPPLPQRTHPIPSTTDFGMFPFHFSQTLDTREPFTIPLSILGSQSMRPSKSVPEHASRGGSIARKVDKNSIYFDSGISTATSDYKSLYVHIQLIYFVSMFGLQQIHLIAFRPLFHCLVAGAAVCSNRKDEWAWNERQSHQSAITQIHCNVNVYVIIATISH